MNKKQQKQLSILIALLFVGYVLYLLFMREKNRQQYQQSNQELNTNLNRPSTDMAYLGTDTFGNPVSVTPNRNNLVRR